MLDEKNKEMFKKITTLENKRRELNEQIDEIESQIETITWQIAKRFEEAGESPVPRAVCTLKKSVDRHRNVCGQPGQCPARHGLGNRFNRLGLPRSIVLQETL